MIFPMKPGYICMWRPILQIGSPIHFKRLLLNILGNAIKYNRPHGKVYVSCREISFDGKTVVLEMVIRIIAEQIKEASVGSAK